MRPPSLLRRKHVNRSDGRLAFIVFSWDRSNDGHLKRLPAFARPDDNTLVLAGL
jgi:hypothetical protein